MLINKRQSVQAASASVIYWHVFRDPPLRWWRCSHTDLLPTPPHPSATAAALGPVSGLRWSREWGLPLWCPPSCPLRPPQSRRCSSAAARGHVVLALSRCWGAVCLTLSQAWNPRWQFDTQQQERTTSLPPFLPPSARLLFQDAWRAITAVPLVLLLMPAGTLSRWLLLAKPSYQPSGPPHLSL